MKNKFFLFLFSCGIFFMHSQNDFFLWTMNIHTKNSGAKEEITSIKHQGEKKYSLSGIQRYENGRLVNSYWIGKSYNYMISKKENEQEWKKTGIDSTYTSYVYNDSLLTKIIKKNYKGSRNDTSFDTTYFYYNKGVLNVVRSKTTIDSFFQIDTLLVHREYRLYNTKKPIHFYSEDRYGLVSKWPTSYSYFINDTIPYTGSISYTYKDNLTRKYENGKLISQRRSKQKRGTTKEIFRVKVKRNKSVTRETRNKKLVKFKRKSKGHSSKFIARKNSKGKVIESVQHIKDKHVFYDYNSDSDKKKVKREKYSIKKIYIY